MDIKRIFQKIDINKIVRSKAFKRTLTVIGGLAILFSVFFLGLTVGLKKANYTVQWEETYEQNFGGPGRSPMPPPNGMLPSPRDFLNAHGVAGLVLKIGDNTLTVKGENNTEKNVAVDDGTTITSQRRIIRINSIRVGDDVVVMGSPDSQGQINATFIRVFPR